MMKRFSMPALAVAAMMAGPVVAEPVIGTAVKVDLGLVDYTTDGKDSSLFGTAGVNYFLDGGVYVLGGLDVERNDDSAFNATTLTGGAGYEFNLDRDMGVYAEGRVGAEFADSDTNFTYGLGAGGRYSAERIYLSAGVANDWVSMENDTDSVFTINASAGYGLTDAVILGGTVVTDADEFSRFGASLTYRF